MARSKPFKMRLSDEEYDRFTTFAAEHGIYGADLVRPCVLGPGAAQKLPPRDLLQDILRQLTRVATNLNHTQKSTQ